MGNDAVVACYGKTVANYWNRDVPFYSLPIEVRIIKKYSIIFESSVKNSRVE
jgi:hypothetical protein